MTKWRKSEGRLSKHDRDDFEHTLRGKLEFLKSVQGEIEPVCRKLLLRFNELPDRRTGSFRLLPISAIELLRASTYCLEITKYVGPVIDGSAPVCEHFTGTAFFLKDVGLVTCEHCTGEEMQIYHPDRKHLKYRVRPLKVDVLADVAILEVLTMLPPTSVELEVATSAVAIGDEVRVAGFPSKFPEGAISMARTEVIATYDRSRHPVIWKGDTTIRYLIEKGVPDGVSGGPVLDAQGTVIGLGAKGPSEDDPLVPCEVVPISAVQKLLHTS
ncbi:S1 family peptidase [Bradyrhizobium diazoefficiens]|uniref:S1 family peptidase n=1 Tax=Bradyrhizobium diazoefficiens TaxID=1355477 RepID=UPI0027295A3B|nr:serine protease [Bradyrhizobium diazoefficiens]WLA64616.1 serine protease [Bradyrhizobium diazoefficiens]